MHEGAQPHSPTNCDTLDRRADSRRSRDPCGVVQASTAGVLFQQLGFYLLDTLLLKPAALPKHFSDEASSLDFNALGLSAAALHRTTPLGLEIRDAVYYG